MPRSSSKESADRPVIIFHSAVGEGSSKDETDVLEQAHVVGEALRALGYTTLTLPFDLNAAAARESLLDREPRFVFNLVETMEGSGRLIHIAPSLFDHWGIPYTGASAEALYLTSNKCIAKTILAAFDVPTPTWFTTEDLASRPTVPFGKYIIKSVWEHASIGLDAGSIVATDEPKRLGVAMERRKASLGGSCFAERYIEGQEFNVALLGRASQPEVLPIAEMCFVGWGQNRERIVDYRAKWDVDSPEYECTQRSFEFAAADGPLLERLSEVARRCWAAFQLRGYARVDFRVDSKGSPWVLEVNANPCLAPGAGFAAAAHRAGIGYTELVRRIVEAVAS